MTHDIHTLAAGTKDSLDRTKGIIDRLADKPEAHGHLADIVRRVKTSVEYELVELEKIAEMLGL